MHLITLQKSMQSLELAVEQGIDSTRLLQKARDSVSDLRQEAASTGNEDLLEGSAQILAYLDTVGEGRLDLNDEGVHSILDFVSIFKDALGDAAPGIKMLSEKRLAEWNEGYQLLMARMKPISEEEPACEEPQDEAAEVSSSFLLDEAAEGPSEDLGVLVQDTKEIGQDAEGITAEKAEAVNSGEAAVPDDEVVLAEEHEPEGLFEPAEPAEALDIHDVKIPDSETVSAREAIEAGHLQASDHGNDFISSNGKALTPLEFRPKRNGDNPKTPVQLEEVERLKKKLLELHEKQEMLSSKMSGILVDLKSNADSESEEREPVSLEEMGVNELEDLIFIGRKKG